MREKLALAPGIMQDVRPLVIKLPFVRVPLERDEMTRLKGERREP